jgi:hypothetical protein
MYGARPGVASTTETGTAQNARRSHNGQGANHILPIEKSAPAFSSTRAACVKSCLCENRAPSQPEDVQHQSDP